MADILSLKLEKRLNGGITRNIFLCRRGNKKCVLKIYSNSLKCFIFDFCRSVLSVIAFYPNFEFIDLKKRIFNEINGRKNIRRLKISTSKVQEYSVRKKYIIENFIRGKNLFNCKKLDKKMVFRIGEYTAHVHLSNFSFMDNRPQNYILSGKKLVRIDLESFKTNPSNFDKSCDVISFIKSFKNKDVGKSFLKGYNRYCEYAPNRYVEKLCSLFLYILNKL